MSTAKVIPHQRFINGEVHDWYRMVWGFSDHLVSDLLEEFKPDGIVLDPFCGSGTTLVECKKRGVASIGIDANPASCFAAKVKTNWALTGSNVIQLLESIRECVKDGPDESIDRDLTYRYLHDSGMVARGWISRAPLLESVQIKKAIQGLRTDSRYKDALNLALLKTVVRSASNIKFGPEIYCGKPKLHVDVFEAFSANVTKMATDYELAKRSTAAEATVIEGDARFGSRLIRSVTRKRISTIICSPPYPTEHDYTRNSRLELAFLEEVSDRDTLRSIKRSMIRSHTKGIYAGDSDSLSLLRTLELERIVTAIRRKSAKKSHGFARLYPTVVREYFGGMKRHFENLLPVLRKNSRCAYVVGDQSSYLQVPIHTARILGEIAEQVGYKVVEIRHWRDRVSSTTAKRLRENILILQPRA